MSESSEPLFEQSVDTHEEKLQPKQPDVLSRPIFVKLGLIALIFGLLQIPLLLISGAIVERQTYNVDFPKEFNGPGAKAQTIIGPILTVPYRYQVVEEKQVTSEDAGDSDEKTTKVVKVTKTKTDYLHFFPDSLNISGSIDPQIRDEGKFKSILYSTTLSFKGTFNTTEFTRKKISENDLVWQDAFIAVGISDLRGIRKQSILQWAGRTQSFIPGTNGLKLFDSGQYVPLEGMKGAGVHPFEFSVYLNGSRDFSVFPAGKENKITLTSSWNDPAFTGGYLPNQKTVDQKGFSSIWEVSYFTRNLPQIWTDRDADIKNSLAQYMVGVTLATPVEFYRTAIRAVKYGSLFIVMTFLTFFIFETVSPIKIHEVQYLLVGLALSLFFLLLIAISEWVPFVWAYALACIPTIAQITWYTRAFSRGVSRSLWKVMAATLTALYVYLYILLQLENLSLLVGAIGLFIALTIVLYTTRNTNWYGKDARSIAQPSEVEREAF